MFGRLDKLAQPWLIAAGLLVASVLTLAAVHALETFAHLAPCPLCLRQRLPFWWAIPVAAFAVFALRPGATSAALRTLGGAALGGLVILFAVSAGFGMQHIGVEENWWEAACTVAKQTTSIEDMLANVGRDPLPACDEKSPFLFGLTLAAYNFLLSIFLTGLAGLGAWRALVRPALKGTSHGVQASPSPVFKPEHEDPTARPPSAEKPAGGDPSG